MKINSNTIGLKKGDVEYSFIETIISKIAADNSIENIDSINISLSPNAGYVEFKTALDTTQEVKDPIGNPQGQSNLPVPVDPAAASISAKDPTALPGTIKDPSALPGTAENKPAVDTPGIDKTPGAPVGKEQEISDAQVNDINDLLKQMAIKSGEGPEGVVPGASGKPVETAPTKIPGEENAPQPQTA